MNTYITAGGVTREVFVDGDQAPAFTLSLSDLLDPSSIRGTRSSTIRILNTPESRAVLGSEAMMSIGPDRPTIKFLDGGIDVFTSEIVVLRSDRNVFECAAVGGNAMWFEWAKKTKLREFDFGDTLITKDFMMSTWTDQDSMLYFPLINTGSILQRANTYDLDPVKLRPCVRYHRALDDLFSSIDYRLRPHGFLKDVWKKFVVFHPTDELSREIPSLYLTNDYVSGPSGWFDGSQYFVPTATVLNGTVELVDYSIGYDPFDYAFDDAIFTVIVYDFTTNEVLAELTLPPVVVGGSLVIDHLFTNVRFTAGHNIGTAVQMADMPGPLTYGTGGPVSRVRYSDGVDTLELAPLIVTSPDLSDSDNTGPFIVGSPLSVSAAMPDMTVIDFFKAIINAQKLVVVTDPISRTIDIYFESEFFRPLTAEGTSRNMTHVIDHTIAPAKVQEQQPAALLLKWKDDKADHYLRKANKIIGGTVGYGNGLSIIERGTKERSTLEIPYAATAMGKVFAGLLVPTMIKEGGTFQEDSYDFEDRLLIADGMRDGTWKLDGDTLTEYPYAYFANDEQRGHMLAFDNAAIYGDTRPGVMFTLWSARISIMRNSKMFEANTLWEDHELTDFDFGMPTRLHDGHSEGTYYVQEIKDHRFGRDGMTKTVYIEAPQEAAPVMPSIIPDPEGFSLTGGGTSAVNGDYLFAGMYGGWPMWTKAGGTDLEDSVYYEPAISDYVITTGGTYASSPANALYYTNGAPPGTGPAFTWLPYYTGGGSPGLPSPTYVP